MNARKDIPLFAELLFLGFALVVAVFGGGIWSNHAQAPGESLFILAFGLLMYTVARPYYQKGLRETDQDLRMRHTMKATAFMWFMLGGVKTLEVILFRAEHFGWTLGLLLALHLLVPALYLHRSGIPVSQWPQWMRGPKSWAEIQEEKRAKTIG